MLGQAGSVVVEEQYQERSLMSPKMFDVVQTHRVQPHKIEDSIRKVSIG